MDIQRYNERWTSMSKDSSESMPVGGHDLGLNVWVEKGDLLFYVDRSGSFDENNQMLKLGRVRLELEPNTLKASDCKFLQELKLKEGYIQITAQAIGFPSVTIQIWVEVFRPVVHIEVNSNMLIHLKASYENWRFEEKEVFNRRACLSTLAYPGDITTKPDVVAYKQNGILFYHRNNTMDLIFDKVVKEQGLESYKDQLINTQKNLTFGGLFVGDNMSPSPVGHGSYGDIEYKSWTLRSDVSQNSYKMAVYFNTAQSDTYEIWENELLSIVEEPVNVLMLKGETEHWWKEFWERSYIFISPETSDSEDKGWEISRNYTLFRYMLGCNAYGSYPTKFNGGLFTTDPIYSIGSNFKNHSPDYRDWGGGSFTAQNQRLVYWPMLKSGDFDMMYPQFDYYLRSLPNAELRSKVYWGHEGCSFSEQLENFGLPIGGGWGWLGSETPMRCRTPFTDPTESLTPWTKYLYLNQLEFSFMILKTFQYSDIDISKYLPFIESSIVFFDEHYQYRHYLNTNRRLDRNGHLVIFPSTACESYKDATNPSDVIAALMATTQALLALPKRYLSKEKRAYYNEFYSRIPPMPFRNINGKRTIAPAQSWSEIINCEIPQLYPLFPYELYGVDKKDLKVAIDTWTDGTENEDQKNYISWHQDNIFCARLGLTSEAAEITIKKLEKGPRRFPTFWGPGHDWVPDHNWGGSGMIGLQDMLLQTADEKILLFPAWPKEWDVQFKLHAPQNTVVECSYKKGIINKLIVTPESRKADLVIKL